MSTSDTATQKTWFLEGVVPSRDAWRIEVSPLPFRIGRRATCNLRLNSVSVSGEHAELTVDATGGLCIEDLGSTNGTFLNLQRVDEMVRVSEGDVLHFADQEFRVCGGDEGVSARSTAAVSPEVINAMRGDVERRNALLGYIEDRKFGISFQPIVAFADGAVHGYEALARSVVREFFGNADELFSEAERLSLSVELSEVLRSVTAAEAAVLGKQGPLFINTHPFELHDSRRLLRSVDEFLERVTKRQVVLEIHEMAITEVDRFAKLRNQLARRGVMVAFDDFGRGQSRFLELADLEPEYVKFDRAALSGGLQPNDRRYEMVSAMVSLVRKMGQKSVAEGIETDQERELCKQLGFDFGQGYLLGRPRPADEPSTFDGVKLER